MLTLYFEQEKETKNTVRFQELESDEHPILVGTLYLQKFACKQLGGGAIPGKITVTIN